MKKIVSWLLCWIAPLAIADNYSQLYLQAGWSTQVDHFHEVLIETQKQYQNKLPVMLYQALVISSNQRFEPNAMKARGEKVLREQLVNPTASLTFFNSPVGKKVVAAETEATKKEVIQKNKQGIPLLKISAQRQALIERLSNAVPYEQGAVNSITAVTNLAVDSLESMVPGMGVGNAVSQLVIPPKQIEQQVHSQLPATLAYVYRYLSDGELQQFVAFAESDDGKLYYHAVLSLVDVSLNNK